MTFAGLGDREIDQLYNEIFEALDGNPAPCRADPEPFFEHADPEDWVRAICEACPAKTSCAAYAIAAGEPYGLWGDLSEKERKAFRRKRTKEQRHHE